MASKKPSKILSSTSNSPPQQNRYEPQRSNWGPRPSALRGRGRARESADAPPSPHHSTGVCFSFQETGHCRFGERCRYLHTDEARRQARVAPSSSQASSRPQASEDVSNFLSLIQNLAHRPGALLRLNTERDLSLWRAVWDALSAGASSNAASSCLKVLLRLPASSRVAPHPTQLLKAAAAVTHYANCEVAQTHVVLDMIDLVVEVMKKRLVGRPNDGHSCLQIVEDIRTSGHAALMSVLGNPRLAQRASALLGEMFTVLAKYATELEQNGQSDVVEIDAANDAAVAWSGWQAPTLSWLQRGTWLNALPLGNKYESIEVYANALREMFSMLTFYWGAGAVFPKCRMKAQEDRYCDQPLCVPVKVITKYKCCGRILRPESCSGAPVWRCFRHGHDAICARCLRQSQSMLVGVPGSRASTDIYDAVVERETSRKGGVIYIASQLASRKPPSVRPNWRTTYRLNCSALVGVIRLAASCESLKAHAKIDWAEIVPVHSQKGIGRDHLERQCGRIALRLLNRSDLSTLQYGAEGLQVGQRIAIIDLQVFVPEVVSVLSALADSKLTEHLANIRFGTQLTGDVDVPESEEHGPRSGIEEIIQNALQATEIDSICRLSSDAKKRLAQDIITLAKEASLEGTQLDAFAAALSKSLHCTQGPPGSGKSYLGVVLIRALDRIRSASLQNGQSVGPILVLSYKNHSLDEVLVDLLDSEKAKLGIIRCGKPENERLHPFTERRSPFELAAQSTLTDRVTRLRSVRCFVRDLRSAQSALRDETRLVLREWTSNQSDRGKGIDAIIELIVEALRFHLALLKQGNSADSCEAYSILESTMSQPTLSNAVELQQMMEVIPGLTTGMEHWRAEGNRRIQFLLKQWVSGAEPPSRCAASKEDGCAMPSKAENTYCDLLHKCQHPDDCPMRRSDGFKYCRDHYCCFQGGGCYQPRVGNSRVCEEHGCKLCVATNRPEIMPKVGAACEEHTCRELGCADEYLSSSLPYCSDHACRLCRRMEVDYPREVKSVRRIENSLFCAEHKCTAQGCSRYRLQQETIQNFCAMHACVTCDGTRQQVDMEISKSRLCKRHRCSHVDADLHPCTKQRRERSIFCSKHTCQFCLGETEVVVKPVMDLPPRNACSDHPLCTFVMRGGGVCCKRTHRKNIAFCEHHFKGEYRQRQTSYRFATEKQCSGIAKSSNRRCKARGISIHMFFYCNAHLDQQPDSDHELEAVNEESEGTDDSSDETSVSSDDGVMDVDCTVLTRKEVENAGFKQLETTNPVLESHAVTADNSTEQSNSSNPISKQENPIIKTIAAGISSNNDSWLREVQYEKRKRVKRESDEDEKGDRDDVEVVVSSQEMNTELSGSGAKGMDRLPYGLCQDELEVTSESSDEREDSMEELPDHLQRLHEIVGEDSTDDLDTDVDEIVGELASNEASQEILSANLKEWIWGIPLVQRCLLAANFIERSCARITKLVISADAYVEEARQELAEAAAFTFKRAHVIGATVVGATRRLQSLRACEPFAMVVEEACEIMEPTLLSVLSVRSLQKLEMIGDHRQLPAFIQPCWFAFQRTHPSIQISLFERLVHQNKALVTVLDVQRRMCPEISDLIRCEYEDIVQIVDHECTRVQRIADRIVKSELTQFKHNRVNRLEAVRRLWSDKGNSVPGMACQVFFWDIKTSESCAPVGMSRCNNGEAKACSALVQWLLRCGIPTGSISIITPFKGQKIAILRMLMEIPNSKAEDVLVSTIDRYQGDENDIVILSLVSTKPGNRFVALRNRFIVSTSRARLGFYIIGSSSALTKTSQGGEGPLHWRRLLADFGHCPQIENRKCGNFETEDAPTRIGSKLRICCPRHHSKSRDVLDVNDFPRSKEDLQVFCAEQCTFILPWCAHRCQLQCHPSERPHTSVCSIIVERPCGSHSNVPLKCHEVLEMDTLSNGSLTEALKNFKCNVPVPHCRADCPHIVNLPCHTLKDLTNGLFELPECFERVDDFINPSCGHGHSNPTCAIRRQWEEVPPLCLKKVVHLRSCGCQAEMSCDDHVREVALEIPPPCLEAVIKPRPRCGHRLSARCHEATLLQELWNEQEGEAVTGLPPTVMHGTHYGPSEAELSTIFPNRLMKKIMECQVTTTYVRSCGHATSSSCSKAFNLAKGIHQEHPCTEEVSVISPLCGHEIRVSCHLSEAMTRLDPSIFEQSTDPDTGFQETIADEKVLLNFEELSPDLKKFHRICNRTFVLRKECGHKTDNIPCSSLLSILTSKEVTPCMTAVEVKRSCGHTFMVPCGRREEPSPTCNHPVDEGFVYPSCPYGHKVIPATCHELSQLNAAEDPRCPIIVSTQRFRCSHKVDVPCHLKLSVSGRLPGHHLIPESNRRVVEAGVDYCLPGAGAVVCAEPVVFRRECGHETLDVPCGQAFEWASSAAAATPCHVLVQTDSPLCGHSVEVECHLKESLQTLDPWSGNVPTRITIALMEESDQTGLIVFEGKNTPAWSSVLDNLKCGLQTRLHRICGHEEDIPCETLFARLKAKCGRFEEISCDNCGNKSFISCQDLADEGKLLCRNVVEKICFECKINKAKAECCAEKAYCESVVSAYGSCGHLMQWLCGEEEDPRLKPAHACLSCLRESWFVRFQEIRVVRELVENEETSLSKVTRIGNALGLQAETLMKNLRERAFSLLPSSVINMSEEIGELPLEALLSSYCDILEYHVNCLSKLRTINEEVEVSLKEPPDLLSVTECYDIVFTILRKNQVHGDSLKMVDTQYGLGTRATLLSLESLHSEISAEGTKGSFSICVAAAFKRDGVEGVAPFRAPVADLRREKGKKRKRKAIEKANLQARRLMQEFILRGYDHICGEQAASRIYWIPGTVFPVLKVEIQLTVTCGICYDDIMPTQTWTCRDGHALCRNCFNFYVEEAMKPGRLKRTVDSDGNVLCPHDGCGVRYEPLHLLNQEHDATEEELRGVFDNLQELRMSARSQRETSEALEQQKMQLEAEFRRIQNIKDLDERKAESLRMEIVEEILTLRCPVKTCRAAFLDFDGCFALTCGNGNCRAHFCAWCVSHHSHGNIHNHVARCPEGSASGYYHSMEVFKSHHRRRAKRLIVEKLSEEDLDVRKRTLERMTRELRDLDIDITNDELS